MKKCIISTIIFAIVIFNIVFAQKPQSIQYIFPLHKSILNARASQVIIRPGNVIEGASVTNSGVVTVTGSESGKMSGQLILAADDKTMIFKPDHKFYPGETVTVKVNPGLKDQNDQEIPVFSFYFRITPQYEPLKPDQYVKELKQGDFPPGISRGVLEKSAQDTLPFDFPSFTIDTPGDPSDGYLFFSPTYFITDDGYNVIADNSGNIVYYEHITGGAPVDFKVTPNGLLSYGAMYEYHTFVGGGPTVFYLMDSSYSVVDSFKMGNDYVADSHEFQLLPNGHALLLSYDLQEVDMSQVVTGGHPGALVAGSIIQELDTDKNVIFQWRSWDHYQLTDSYNDLTKSLFDAIHINSIEMDNDNHLLLSAMALGEITKVNRQTGEIIWRMGGKNNQFTFINESEEHAPLYFLFQHDVRRLGNGNITVFDGGEYTRRAYSRIVEYQVDEQVMTATNVWEYRHDPDIFASNMGSAQRLPNGNTLIGWGMASYMGNPAITEVDPAGNVVLELTFDRILLASYRAFRFDWQGGLPAAEVMRYEMHVGDTVRFDVGGQITGVILEFNSMGGIGYNEATVRVYNYGPRNPEFPGKAPVVLPVRVTVPGDLTFNIYNANAEFSFNVDHFQFEDPDSIIVYYRQFEGQGLFIPLPTTYNHVTNEIRATISQTGTFEAEFVFACQDLHSVSLPPFADVPADSGHVDQTKPVQLKWIPVGYVNSYDLQVADNPEFTGPVIDETYLASAVYETESLEENSFYFWRVRSRNDTGISDWSQTRIFETTAPFVEVTVPNGGEMWQLGLRHFIQWDDIIEEDMVIELYRDDAYLMLIDTVGSTGGYSWDIPISMENSYNYKIMIRSSVDDAVYDMSDESFAILDSIAPPPPEKGFSLRQNFPNPVDLKISHITTITYTLSEPCHVKLELFDLLGKKVATLVNQTQTEGRKDVDLNVTNLASGIYFYRLQAKNYYSKTLKMVITK